MYILFYLFETPEDSYVQLEHIYPLVFIYPLYEYCLLLSPKHLAYEYCYVGDAGSEAGRLAASSYAGICVPAWYILAYIIPDATGE